MAFDFAKKKPSPPAEKPSAPAVVTVRDVLMRKAADDEKARLKREAQIASSPSRKPRIPNALYAGGKVNLPLPSQLMGAKAEPEASGPANPDVEPTTTAVANPDVQVQAPVAGNPDVLVIPSRGIPPPRTTPAVTATVVTTQEPKRKGFSFSGGPSSAEDFAALGMAAPPDVKADAPDQADHGARAVVRQPIPAHRDTDFDPGLPPEDDIPLFDERGSAIVSQKGLGTRASGMTLIAGIPDSAFNDWHPDVPPGSHYEPWVWDAMDKPGHVTIELYVDTRHLKAAEPSVLERAYQPKDAAGLSRATPKFDPSYHVLVSVPQPRQAPWQDARRVLLTPETIKRMAPIKKKQQNEKMNFGAKKKEADGPEPVYWESDPAGISAWLNQQPHQNVIFGRCLLDVKARDGGAMHWMVLSRNDAMRVHRNVYGDDPRHNLDEGKSFGREGLVPSKTVFDEMRRKSETTIIPPEERTPVPPAKRYLGHWSDKSVRGVIKMAQEQAGPQLPEEWTEDDVQYVKSVHAGIAARAEGVEASKTSPVIAPRHAPAVPLPPPEPKKDAPVNHMRMRV